MTPVERSVARSAFGLGKRRHRADRALDVDRVLWAGAEGEWGVVLGQRLSGEHALPSVGRALVLSPQRLERHLLVTGATGSGKTETALRVAYAIAHETDAPVFYLDGKGDRQTAQRFCGLMQLAGRVARVFPLQAFDGWRGDAHDVHNRLVEVIDYSSEGPAAWYRDVAKATLMLACTHPDGPPRCSEQLLARLDYRSLATTHGRAGAAGALTADLVRQVKLRYEAFFGSCRGQLDGDWSWEDTDAAYLLVDSLALKDEAGSLARLLFEDFTHFFTTRKPRDRFCVLIVDEFSALAQAGSMASRIEQARGFHTALVLAPQVAAGMGDETEAARILGSVETVICHRVNTPEEIVALAGTRIAIEHSVQYADTGATGVGTARRQHVGTARRQHQYKIDPNRVRSLPTGQAYIISRGKATHARIAQAPLITAALPAVDAGKTGSHRNGARTGAPTDGPVAQSAGLPY